MNKVYLSLGSNMGDKIQHLKDAVSIIKEYDRVSNVMVSSFYETAPVGYLDQDLFVNIALSLDTEMEPYEMLSLCQHVEEELKRKRIIRWGPRTIDVDILLFNDIISNDEKLTIPHPRMKERAFVIVPLYEIANDISIDGDSIESIYQALDKEDIRKIADE